MDFSIKLSNGKLLNGVIQSPGENIRAVVIMVHGLGEHIQRYNHWAEMFRKEGIGFTGMDLPGHGRSEGRRGNIKSYDLLDEMINILINNCKMTFPGLPIFLYGHSLGGGVVLNYLVRKNPRIKGAIASAPLLRLAFQPPKIKLLLASVMKFLLPGLVQPSGLEIKYLSHDTEVVEKYRTDPLVHGKISVSLFQGSMSAADYTLHHASELKVPTLIIHGSDDIIVSPEGSREFAGKAEMAEIKIWAGGFHELHNEPFNKEVFGYIMNWINSKLV